MAFDSDPTLPPVPENFAALYSKWRKAGHGGSGNPYLAFVAWVDTTMDIRICEVATEEDMASLRRAMLEQSGDEVGEMLWEGMEAGP